MKRKILIPTPPARRGQAPEASKAGVETLLRMFSAKPSLGGQTMQPAQEGHFVPGGDPVEAYSTDGKQLEIVCDNCRGLGHIRRVCPSVNRFRSFQVALETLGKARYREARERTVQEYGDKSRVQANPGRSGRSFNNRNQPRRFQQKGRGSGAARSA